MSATVDYRGTLGLPAAVPNLFIFGLLLVSLSTVFLYPMFPSFFRPTAENPHITYLIIGWFSTAHVATTGFFYVDRQFIPHIQANPSRYVFVPILTIITCALLWGLIDKQFHVYLWMIFISWLLWHYQKQNYGLTALVSSIKGGDRLTALERNSIMAVSVGSIIAVFRFKAEAISLPHLDRNTFYTIGLCIYATAACLCCYSIFLRLKTKRKNNLYAGAFIAISVIFFAPTFLATGYFPAVTSYAVAHGLQYWLMMTSLMVSSRFQNGLARSVFGFSMVVLTIWGAIWLARGPYIPAPLVNFAIGIQFGITIAHFIIDADAWRLSEKYQRTYIKSRLSYLFK